MVDSGIKTHPTTKVIKSSENKSISPTASSNKFKKLSNKAPFSNNRITNGQKQIKQENNASKFKSGKKIRYFKYPFFSRHQK